MLQPGPASSPPAVARLPILTDVVAYRPSAGHDAGPQAAGSLTRGVHGGSLIGELVKDK